MKNYALNGEAGIHKEFHDMIVRGVWRNMKKRDIPKGRRCIKCDFVREFVHDGFLQIVFVHTNVEYSPYPPIVQKTGCLLFHN